MFLLTKLTLIKFDLTLFNFGTEELHDTYNLETIFIILIPIYVLSLK